MNRFTFLGFAAFLIETDDGRRILIDPYLDKNESSPIKAKDIGKLDLLLISHAAFDHIGEADIIAKNTGCAIVCGGDSKAWLLERGVCASQIQETVWGLMVEAAGIRVRPVESRHRSACKLMSGETATAIPLGFIVELPDGTRLYNASDTAIFSDLKLIGELQKPDIGLMNVTIENCFDFLPNYLTGEMTPDEAALASQWLGLDVAIACHYTRRDCPDVNRFVEILENARAEKSAGPRPIALKPGETFEYSRAR